MRAGESFLLDGVVSSPDLADSPADASAHHQDLALTPADGDALMPLPPGAQAPPPAARRGRGGSKGGGSGGGNGGGAMLRMLSVSAQDTLGSLTGRAAAAEWARHQVCAKKSSDGRPASCQLH